MTAINEMTRELDEAIAMAQDAARHSVHGTAVMEWRKAEALASSIALLAKNNARSEEAWLK